MAKKVKPKAVPKGPARNAGDAADEAQERSEELHAGEPAAVPPPPPADGRAPDDDDAPRNLIDPASIPVGGRAVTEEESTLLREQGYTVPAGSWMTHVPSGPLADALKETLPPPPSAPANPDRRAVAVKESVNLKLTEAERDAAAREAAALYGKVAVLEAEFDAVKKDWQARIKEASGAAAKSMKAANEGVEYRTVPGVRVFDLKAKRSWVEIRGDAYNERPMTWDEQKAFEQRNLFGEPPIIPGVTPARDDDPVPTEDLVPGGSNVVDPKRQAAATSPGAIPRVSKADASKAIIPDRVKPKRRAKGEKAKVEVVSAFPNGESHDVRDVMREESSKRGKVDHTL